MAKNIPLSGRSTSPPLPPYPRVGECYRALALVLGTKAANREVDRLAREGDYDWAEAARAAQALFFDPIAKSIDKGLAQILDDWLKALERDYRQVVFGVTLATVGRDEVLPILVRDYFVPVAAHLLMAIHAAIAGPDLLRLLSPDHHPLAEVLDWLDAGEPEPLAKVAFPGSTGNDRSYREMVRKWRRGSDTPDLQSIKLFAEALARSGAVAHEKLVRLRVWLLVGRALAVLDRMGETSVRGTMLRYLLAGMKLPDVGAALHGVARAAAEPIAPVESTALQLYEELRRTTKKLPGDQERTRVAINELQQLMLRHDPEGHGLYHLAWMRARWNVLSGNVEETLNHLESACDLASYRAGSQEKQLLEETLAVAAHLGKRPLLKRLKHRAIAAGVFATPTSENVIDAWEIDQIARQFDLLFPTEGRFAEAPGAERNLPVSDLLVLSGDEIKSIKPDLALPQRKRKVATLDGQSRRWPQLQLFAFLGDGDAVARLLAANASVDALDDAGGSALLAALQRANDAGDDSILRMILEKPHAQATLDSATIRKRLTPLSCAVDLGRPDVVAKLLEQGASPDRRAGTAEQTALYQVMGLLGSVIQPANLLRELLASGTGVPDDVQRETFRRYGITTAGMFGDGKRRIELLRDPRNRQLFEELAQTMARVQTAKHSPESLLQIAKLLLQHGANSNTPHRYPVPGRTPLMVAAEVGLAPVFELMMEFGGDPLQCDGSGLNCIQIAMGFGAGDVIHCLRERNLT